jgi:RIO kinase 1
MTTSFNWEEFDEFEVSIRHPRKKARKPSAVELESSEATDAEDGMFHPSFAGSKHEREWLRESMGSFHGDCLITDVLRAVRGGKEATVYCCRAHPSTGEQLLAAKVYRPKEFRTLRNDALYREGRLDRDGTGKHVKDRRAQSAIEKRTKAGQAILHATWLGHEFRVMQQLYDAGADVPRPVAQEQNAILMGYVGSEEFPAPTLSQVDVPRAEARPLLERMLGNLEILLRCGFVHGDLSAYNVLYWEGRITVIDFPQAVDPFHNRSAFDLFRRDVARICGYFAKHGVNDDAEAIASRLWDEARLPR